MIRQAQFAKCLPAGLVVRYMPASVRAAVPDALEMADLSPDLLVMWKPDKNSKLILVKNFRKCDHSVCLVAMCRRLQRAVLTFNPLDIFLTG